MTALEPAQFVDPPEQPLDLPTLAAHTHNKRPILPGWMRNAGEFRALLAWLTKYGAHTTGFHVARIPLYVARLVGRSPRGGWVLLGTWWCWAWHMEQRAVRLDAVRRSATTEYLHLSRLQKERVTARWIVTAVVFVPLSLGVTVFLLVAPTWRVYASYALVVLALGVVGTAGDRAGGDLSVGSAAAVD